MLRQAWCWFPGSVALLVFLVFTYLYEQSRQGLFPCLATGMGCLYAALRTGSGWPLPRPFRDPVLCEFASVGGNGDVHLRLHPANEGSISFSVA